MAIKFQYNKTALQQLNKQLNIRLRALPILKNKEAALRMEIKKAKEKMYVLEKHLTTRIQNYSTSAGLWNEFKPDLITIGEVSVSTKKTAGVKIPILETINFREEEFSIFNNPGWFPEGITVIKELAEIVTEKEFFNRKVILLEYARRKTTQKVNLYEKVQIPGYQEAILKIKRFLEDEENLSKSAQKIVKKRQQKQREELI